MNPSANPTPVRHSSRRARAVAALAGLVALIGAATLLPPSPAPAQTPGVSISINPIVPPGQSPATLPAGAQIVNFVISNPTPTIQINQQAVIRVALPPAYIVNVTDGTASFGTIDNRTAVWYGLVPSLAPNSSLTLTMTWFQPCPGRWPVAARFGDRTTSLTLGFVGPSDAKCPPDETVAPQGSTYYALPWPPTTQSTGATTTTAVIIPSLTTTVPGQIPTVTTPGAATTTLPGATVTTQPLVATSTTLLRLGPTTTALVTPVQPGQTTTVPPGQTTTTVKKKTTPTTTTVIICKTISGRRYCGPSSSAYKPGQAKAIESKPGQKVTITTKKKTATTKKK